VAGHRAADALGEFVGTDAGLCSLGPQCNAEQRSGLVDLVECVQDGVDRISDAGWWLGGQHLDRFDGGLGLLWFLFWFGLGVVNGLTTSGGCAWGPVAGDTTENTTLKQRVRQLTTDNRTLDERLTATSPPATRASAGPRRSPVVPRGSVPAPDTAASAGVTTSDHLRMACGRTHPPERDWDQKVCLGRRRAPRARRARNGSQTHAAHE
jgi:hypothetical protein